MFDTYSLIIRIKSFLLYSVDGIYFDFRPLDADRYVCLYSLGGRMPSCVCDEFQTNQ